MDGNGANFNAQVEATAFAGEARADIDQLQRDMTEVKTDVRWLRDKMLPAVAVAGAVPTLIAVLAFLKSINLF